MRDAHFSKIFNFITQTYSTFYRKAYNVYKKKIRKKKSD